MSNQVQYVDHMGSDLSVVNAARVSFENESEWEYRGATDDGTYIKLRNEQAAWHHENTVLTCLSDRDNNLINYLAKHKHWTPFAHTSITLRMKAPVPIRTQCFKHKQGFVENEESRRYISSEPELFIPVAFRQKPEGSIKQGSGSIHPDSDMWLEAYKMQCTGATALYNRMIANGVCPEQARLILPQGVQVNWMWTGNVAAYARFCRQRLDKHAQEEVRVLAKEVSKIIAPLYPVSWKALMGE